MWRHMCHPISMRVLSECYCNRCDIFWHACLGDMLGSAGAGWCRRGDGSGGRERKVKSGVSSQSACNSYVKRTQVRAALVMAMIT